MKIIIIGAGELGRLLATKLSSLDNDVTLIDSSRKRFEGIRDKLDVMTLGGEATSIAVMKQAGIAGADVLLAVSGNETANILACQIAGKFGVSKSICRLYSFNPFSEEDGITPGYFGIWKSFSSLGECARRVVDVLKRRILLERAEFSNPDATMATAVILPSSPLCDVRIRDIISSEILSNVRFAALVRGQELKFPHGDTTLRANDKLYITGHRDYVEKFLDAAHGAEENKRKVVLIGGATLQGELIARQIMSEGMEVRFLEKSAETGEALLNRMPQGVMVVKGSATVEDDLLEAGISSCDVFVSAEDDDENNILSCVIAKKMGVPKTVAVTHKPEYINIVPAMDVIDCGFNSSLVSVNAIFKLMDMGSFRMDSRLQAFHAYLTEFSVTKSSSLNGKMIKDCHLPKNMVLAMLFRDGDVIAPVGNTRLQKDDVVVAVVTPATEKQVRALFD